MGILNKIIKLYDNILENIVAILYAGIISIMFSQVVFRYVFNSPRTWAEELSRYLFIWIVYLGAAIAISRRAHLQVDYFIRYLPERFKKYLSLVLNIFIFGFLTLVLLKGLELANEYLLTPTYTMEFLSQWYFYMAIPVGSLFMFLNLLRVIIKDYINTDIE